MWKFLELLKYIPYVTSITWDVQIAYQNHVINHAGSEVQQSIEKLQAEGCIVPAGAGVVPEIVAILTKGWRYGSLLLLDTQEGLKKYRHGHGLYTDGTSKETWAT